MIPISKKQECYWVLAPLSRSYSHLEGRLPTCYSPVRHFTSFPKETFSYDLHVLSTPPAFILSQDQTLQLNWFAAKSSGIYCKTQLDELSLFSFQRSSCRRIWGNLSADIAVLTEPNYLRPLHLIVNAFLTFFSKEQPRIFPRFLRRGAQCDIESRTFSTVPAALSTLFFIFL